MRQPYALTGRRSCLGTTRSIRRTRWRAQSPTSSGPVLRNGAVTGTIAFRERSRPDGPGADERPADVWIARGRRRRTTAPQLLAIARSSRPPLMFGRACPHPGRWSPFARISGTSRDPMTPRASERRLRRPCRAGEGSRRLARDTRGGGRAGLSRRRRAFQHEPTGAVGLRLYGHLGLVTASAAREESDHRGAATGGCLQLPTCHRNAGARTHRIILRSGDQQR